MLWLTYAVIVIAAGIAVTWMMRPHNETKCKECQAIAARLEQRKREPGTQGQWTPGRYTFNPREQVMELDSEADKELVRLLIQKYPRDQWELIQSPTENSASAPFSESAPPSTPTWNFLWSGRMNPALTGDSPLQSPSGSPVRGATPVEETPTESGPAVQRIDMSRGKRESKL